MSTIYLIRHGKTDANEQHLYCGSTDLSLSEGGIADLKQLHYPVGSPRFVTSGMKRTNQTLQILFGDVPFSVEPQFREVDFGDFEMQSYETLKQRPDYQQWLSGNNDENIPPHGESGAQMTQRVIAAFDRYAKVQEDLVIVTHGGVIAALMAHLFPEEGKNRYQWQPQPGHGYALTNHTYAVLGSAT